MNKPTFSQLCARLHAKAPWLTHSEVCATLQARGQRKRHGQTRVAPTLERSAVETPVRYDWQKRADLL